MNEDAIVDTLRIEIKSDSTNAVNGLERLISTLDKLKGSTSSPNKGLSSLYRTLDRISAAISKIDSDSSSKLQSLTSALGELKNVGNLKMGKVADTILDIGAAVDSLKYVDMSKLSEMAEGLSELHNVGNFNRSTIANISTPDLDIDNPVPDFNGEIHIDSTEVVETTSEMHGLKALLDNISSKATDFGDKLRSGFDTARKSVIRFKSDLSEIKSFFLDNAITKRITNLGRMFGRRVIYRAFNAIISMITNGMKEGVNAVYEYSRAIDGTFAKALDRITTSTNYLKGSLGAMVAPLIESVTPFIEKVIDQLVEWANILNQVFSSLAGKTTWTKAVMVASEYEDKINKATSATKKFKASLLAIDELNVLNDNSDSSTSSSSQDPAFKFVEENIDNSVVNDFFDKFNKIKKIVEEIGLALLAWKIGSKVLEFFSMLSRMGTLGKGLASAVTIALEFAGVYWKTSDYLKEEGSWKDLLLAGVIGLLGTTALSVMWGTTGLMIGVGVAALAMLTSVITSNNMSNKGIAKQNIVGLISGVLGSLAAGIAGVKFLKVGFGAGMMGGFATMLGIELAIQNYKAIKSTGVDTATVMRSILSVVAFAIGGALLLGGLVGAAIGLTVGIGVTLLAIFKAFEEDEKNKAEKALEAWQNSDNYKKIQERIDAACEYKTTLKLNIEGIETDLTNLIVKGTSLDKAQSLLNEMFDKFGGENGIIIANEGTLSEIQTYIDAISSFDLDDFNLKLDDHAQVVADIGGNFTTARSEMNEYFEELKKNLQKSSYENIYNKAFEARTEAILKAPELAANYKQAIDDVTAYAMSAYADIQHGLTGSEREDVSRKAYAYIIAMGRGDYEIANNPDFKSFINDLKEMEGYQKLGAEVLEQLATQLYETGSAFLENHETIQYYGDKIEFATGKLAELNGVEYDFKGQLNDTVGTIEDYNKYIGYATDGHTALKNICDKVSGANEDLVGSLDDVEQQAYWTTSAIYGVRNEMVQLDGMKATAQISLEWDEEARQRIWDDLDVMTNISQGFNVWSGLIPPHYANGGEVEDGFFYMNHNEIIGRFSSGKTVVQNNDQIYDEIREYVRDGVYSAVVEANQNNSNGSDGPATIVSVGNGRITKQELFDIVNSVNRRSGKPIIQIN